jgi:VanZ family protein
MPAMGATANGVGSSIFAIRMASGFLTPVEYRSAMRRVMLWLPPVVYMAVIFHFSSESHPVPMIAEHVWDKLLHFLEYGGLGALLYRALRGEGLSGAMAVAVAAAAAAAYGGSDEWHQSFVPLRDSSIRDWLTDLLGGTAGAVLCRTLEKRWPSTVLRLPRPPRR